MKVIYLVCCIVLITGCYTADKALKQVNKANDKFPEAVAKLARDKYPCTDLLKPDTTIVYTDTVVYVDCPDTAFLRDAAEVIKYDTINKIVTKTIRVPVTLPIRTQYITKWYEDSAKLKIAYINAEKQMKAIESLNAANTKLTEKAKRRGIENWIWRTIALIFIGLFVWRKYRQLTTFKIK